MGERKSHTSGPDDLENYKDMDVGDILRRTRLHYGQSLKDIENALRIRESQLKAIEQGEIEKLPGRVYAIGFVRTYAEYLGLDGAKIAQLFKTQYMDAQPKAELSFPVPASESRTPSSWVLILSLVVAFSILYGWAYLSGSPSRKAQNVPAVPQSFKDKMVDDFPAPTGAASGNAMPDETGLRSVKASPDQTEGSLVLLLVKDSWVEIKDESGKNIVSEKLKAGDQYRVPDNPGMTMSLGNAGGVEILIDGRALKPLGEENEMRSDIPLDISFLKTLEFKDPPVEEGVPDSAGEEGGIAENGEDAPASEEPQE